MKQDSFFLHLALIKVPTSTCTKGRSVEPDGITVAPELWEAKLNMAKVPQIKHAAAVKVQVLRVIGGRGVPRSVLLQ